ncbi:amino acid ABC transporter substrate-binding protein [Lusitaniella coriacea LEGE 07157]|uniref:Amino acid ABC transporter substrate-binding protein n=1 Tax=Lusitaniella coriacea LEGE 07157 TaxID=945747 RepID=A0A8J7DY77_9CYAN|nr:ABC transporter substrate-binding protein [Lusitaniella coriacea]MBE9117428.1 amino acid ABC transporter substrate-binding protein [Lusitaniella coriacea LEGE 07157]
MTQKNDTAILILAFLATVALLGGGFWLLKDPILQMLQEPESSQVSSEGSDRGGGKYLQKRLSLGEQILVGADTTPQKEAGVKAFGEKDFEGAIAEFEASLQDRANDPETRIYLNNAKAANSNPIIIATSVPIGGNLNIAKEILRGVAQGQERINQNGGIQGRPLQIVIVNDDNSPKIATQLAKKLVEDERIIAVIGHNSSNASIAAAPNYESGQLVMISSSSDAKKLSEAGDYIFRTIPSIRFQADTLSRYAVNRANIKNIAICVDSGAEYSTSLKTEFTSAMFADGGRVTPIDCDLAASNFSAETAVSQAISSGADGLLLIPAVNRLNLAVEVTQVNQRRLPLLGSSAMYTIETLRRGQAAVKGMVLAVPWHPDGIAEQSFSQDAIALWGGSVNWRTALAYDAVQAIAKGLEEGKIDRQALQKDLSSPNFVAEGASGAIRFLPSGDRDGAALLIKIEPGGKSGTGLDFVPLLGQ